MSEQGKKYFARLLINRNNIVELKIYPGKRGIHTIKEDDEKSSEIADPKKEDDKEADQDADAKTEDDKETDENAEAKKEDDKKTNGSKGEESVSGRSLSRTRQNIVRTIQNNEEKFVCFSTFTFKENVKDVTDAFKMFQRYIRKVRRAFKNAILHEIVDRCY